MKLRKESSSIGTGDCRYVSLGDLDNDDDLDSDGDLDAFIANS